MAYLLPFVLGTYFSGAFLTQGFHAAIHVFGDATFLTGLLTFFGLVVGSEVGNSAAP